LNLIEYIRNKNALWYKVALYLFCVVMVVSFLPKITYFPYNLKDLEGKLWTSNNVIAPYEFSIYKSDDLVNEELDSVLNHTKIYLVESRDEVDDLEKQRRSWYASHTYPKIMKFLDSCYSLGVANYEDSALMKNGKGQIVALVRNQIEQDYLLSDLVNLDYVKMKVNDWLKSDSIAYATLKPLIQATCKVDRTITEQYRSDAINSVNRTISKINVNEVLVRKNEQVTPLIWQKLKSYEREFKVRNASDKNFWLILLGQIMYTGLCFAIIFVFLATFRRNIFSQNRHITFIVIVILLFVFISIYVSSIGSDFVYFIPYALIPVMIRVFFDSRTALFSHLITVFLCTYLAPDRFEFAFIQIITGIVAIFSVANLQSRTRLILASVVILITYIFSFITLLLFKGDFNKNLIYERIPELATASSLVIFAYPLVYLCEKVFGFISDFTLLELSNTNHPLLKELSHKAPGTFHHSLQVANLAEAAAEAIGANPLLTRTGALFHDIGKLDRPRYFVENRSGEADPHKDLPHDISAKIIIDHVIKGIERAKASLIPDQIIDFIRTHHGTSLVKYFYKSYLNEHESSPEIEAKFHYPGPLPFSKETAILMMCDAVEAASRSLQKKDEQSIHQLIEYIVDDQINQQQFVNADITFKDIYKVKKVLKQSLLTIYHSRIEYPS
jgi:cyclic-di-AMP phosphodiesterase PgpH